MATIIYDISQFSTVILMVLTFFFLYMGYGMQGEKGGWFLIFGGLFTISLFIGLVAMFSSIWWFISPGCLLFGIIVFRDGVLKAFFKKE